MAPPVEKCGDIGNFSVASSIIIHCHIDNLWGHGPLQMSPIAASAEHCSIGKKGGHVTQIHIHI